MIYSIQQIFEITGGQWLNDNVYQAHIQHLLYDSRLLVQPQNTLFFALSSQRNDGYKYIETLYQKGVRNFIVQKELQSSLYPKANFILVKNALTALQSIAKFHKSRFQIPTISITGSNGKTIVKEWLYQLLCPNYEIVRSPKSYNSQIGVPMSIWQMNQRHNLAIIEAGISTKNEMAILASIINSQIGIFTNIGDAHNDGFLSIEEKVREKSSLFEQAKTIIYCKDYPVIDTVLNDFKNKELFSWSKGKDAILHSILIEKKDAQTQIKGIFQNKEIEITIPFIDEASIENAIHCWATALVLGIDNQIIAPRFLQLNPVALRLELVSAINNCIMINDSYSADLNSLTIALNFLQQQTTHSKNTVILSDFLQNSTSSNQLYQEIAQLLIQKNITKFIAIGSQIQQIKTSLPNTINVQCFPTTTDFLKQMKTTDFQNETILVKGARKFRFEKIAHRLAQKIHQTTLEINLNALIHNLNIYKNQLLPSTKIMVMVKASAYGSGSSEVAKLLEFNRVDYLAVAYSDEGVELRKSGVTLPILVLNPEPASFDLLIRYQLEPEIYSFSLLKIFREALETFEFSTPYPIHIKVNTGMNRLGFEVDEVHRLGEEIVMDQSIKVESVFSHLAGSDAAQFDDFTHLQAQRYQVFYDIFTKKIGQKPIRHILNSAGIVRFSAYQMDMVRLGVGIYGIDGSAILQDQLQTVSTLKATISQIKDIHPNETIGYNRSGKTNRLMRSATISIGYADGLMRHAGNGQTQVLIKNKLAPIVGNVCMDMSMVDVTNIPATQEGDEVIIFGVNKDINELAKQLGTIPYEIFTNISGRVKRVYFQE